MAKSHEPVLEFLKISKGVSSLRELHHFSWDTLEDMRVKGIIKITKIESGYEVRLDQVEVS